MKKTNQYDTYRNSIDDERFALPIDNYHYTISYVSILPRPEIQRLLPDLISNIVIQSLSTVDNCPRSELTINVGSTPSDKEYGTEQGKVIFVQLANNSPVYDFGLIISNGSIQLQKKRSTLDELIHTLPIYQRILDGIFDPEIGGISQKDGKKLSVSDILGLAGRIYSANHSFGLRLSVGKHIANRNSEAYNTELSEKLVLGKLAVSPGATLKEYECPIGALNPEATLRTDVMYSFEKTIKDIRRQIFVKAENPTNIISKDTFLNFEFRTVETAAKLSAEIFCDLDTPFNEFYRDMILNRFMTSYFYNIDVASKL